MSRPRLGQHFLADEDVLARLVEMIGPRPEDSFLEIGPGQGALTLPLLAAGARVTAVELDAALARGLPKRAGAAAARLQVVHGDAAKPWPAPAADPWRLAGNIPYAISSPVVE
ncbi:MAG: methyltransferase domain-containing protein, partial [Betaproteobacteria bacterium AqS2]|nr:methyltransferase domain-containing protein [Betaproteobacteria bacterium AqS2]